MADKPVLLDIKELSSVADYLLICGGDSERQTKAIATSVVEGLKQNKQRPLGLEGMEFGRWILMDYGDVVAHIFLTEVRAFYDLEGLWVDAPEVSLDRDGVRKAEGDALE